MIITVNIANSKTTFSLINDQKIISNFSILTTMRTIDEYGFLLLQFISSQKIEHHFIEGSIISSVVPTQTHIVSQSINKYLNVQSLIVGPGIKTGLNIKVEDPSSVGSDRLANLVGAHSRHYKTCLVIDFSTATTLDLLSDQAYVGGVTAPGFEIIAHALMNQTAKLPHIEIIKPTHTIAKNTVKSMQSGIVNGFIGQTLYLIQNIQKEFKSPLSIISTGDIDPSILKALPIDEHIPHLTSYGLYEIYKKNQI